MNPVLLFAALQLLPPVVDPVLEPSREPPPGEASEIAAPVDPIPAPPPPPTPEELAAAANDSRLAACAALARTDAQAALAEGARWLLDDGGMHGEACLGFGYAGAEQWAEAAAAFGRAADLARGGQNPALPMLLAQAGNAALAGDDAAAAKARFDEALGVATISPALRGQTLVDRARAHVQLGDGDAAQADLIQAQALVPNDPLVWLFSATLARIQNDLDAAGEFIDRALELDRESAAINLEAGNIAYRLNAPDIARQAWAKARTNDPEGAAGQAAAANLAQLDAQMADDVPVEIRETPNAREAVEETDPAIPGGRPPERVNPDSI